MKDKAIVGNIGHFDNEIDMAGLKKVPGIQRINIKPQYDEWRFPDGHSVMVLAEGRLLNLGLRDRPPELRDVGVLLEPGARAARAAPAQRASTRRRSTCCRSTSTKRWRGCTCAHLGVQLTTLTKEQSDYLGVPVEGPYKPEHYRY